MSDQRNHTKENIFTRRQAIKAVGAGAGTLALASQRLSAAASPAVLPSSQDEPVTIEFWYTLTGPTYEAAIEAARQSFEAANPDIKVNVTIAPWGETLPKVSAGLESGQLPDAAVNYAAFTAGLVDRGAVLPLDDVVENLGGEEYFTPSQYVEMQKFNGQFMGLPYAQVPVVLWYNKQWLEEKGISPPETWDQLLAAAAAIHEPERQRYGILVTSSVYHTTNQSLYSVMLSNGADAVDRETGTEVIINSPETVEAVEFYANLAQYNPPGGLSFEREDSQTAFLTGRIGMWIYGAWLASAILENAPDLFDQMAVTRVPTNKGRGAYLGQTNLILFQHSQYPEQAKRWLEHLLHPDQYIPYALAELTSVPTVEEVLTDPRYTDDPTIQQLKPIIDVAQGELPFAWEAFFPNPRAGELFEKGTIAQMASRVLNDGWTATDAVAEAEATIQAAIDA